MNNSNNTDGQLIILASDGTPWYTGGSTSHGTLDNLTSSSPNSVIPPTVALEIKSKESSQPKRNLKQRASAKINTKPIYSNFDEYKEFVKDDLFWFDIFTKMSKGVFRKGFKFYPYNLSSSSVNDISVDTEMKICGKFVYKAKTKDFHVFIPHKPEVAYKIIKTFMEQHAGIMSQLDQDLAVKITQSSDVLGPFECLPKCWQDVKGNTLKNILISHFAKCIKNKYKLSQTETNDLFSYINLIIFSGVVEDENIILKFGSIVEITGLGICKIDKNISIFPKETKNVQFLTLHHNKQLENKSTKDENVISCSYITPSTAFTKVINVVENNIKIIEDKVYNVDNKLPDNEDVEEFIDGYSKNGLESWIITSFITLIGIINSINKFAILDENKVKDMLTKTTLNVNLENAIEQTKSLLLKLCNIPEFKDVLNITDGSQKLIDSVIFSMDKYSCVKSIFENELSIEDKKISFFNKIIENLKSLLNKSPQILEDDIYFDSSITSKKQNNKIIGAYIRLIKKLISLTITYSERIFKTRKDITNGIYIDSDIYTSASKNTKIININSGKKTSTIKKWNKFLEQLEKRSSNRHMEEKGIMMSGE